MNKFKLPVLMIFSGLALLTIAAARLVYSGPGNRSSVPTAIIRLLECDYSTAPDGTPITIYSPFTNLFTMAGSAQALAWQASYPMLTDPGTPTCTPAMIGMGVMAWTPDTLWLAYPPATFSAKSICSAGQNGWCREGKLEFFASESIPGQEITTIESDSAGVLCSLHSASSSCSWSPPDGEASSFLWANSSFGDSSLQIAVPWKMDRTPPTLSISMPVANGLNGWYVTPPTLSLSASDATSGISSATFSDGGTTQQVTTQGTNAISASASDLAGNVSGTTALVKVDLASPVISITKAGTVGKANWYTGNASMTLGISDAISGISNSDYSLDGNPAVNGGNGVVIHLPDGSHSITVRAWDMAGSSRMTNTMQLVDSVPPVLSVSAPTPDGLNGWYTTPVTLSLSASDATSGLISALFANGQPEMTFNNDGVFTASATALDVAGNISSYSASIRKDSVPPLLSIPLSPDGLNGWYVSLPTLVLSASDTTSGLSSALFSNGQPSFTVSGQGVLVVNAQAADRAGNTASASTTVSVDSLPPSVSISAPAPDGLNGWYVGNPNFSLAASDATSGLASALFSNGKATASLSTDGIFDLHALATDQAGNTASGAFRAKRDATPPFLEIPVSPDGLNDWYVTRPTLTLSASDATSGIASAAFSNGQVHTTSPADGVFSLSATATDYAGNSTLSTRTIRVDTIPPVIDVAVPVLDGTNGWYRGTPTFSLGASDATSGIASASFSGGSTSRTISVDGIFSLSAAAADLAGNTSAWAMTVRRDTTPPDLTISSNPDGQNGWYVNLPTLSLNASDATSGLASVLFSNGQPTTTVNADGVTTLHATALDLAGNSRTASQAIRVDHTPPALYIPSSPDGDNGWYVSFPSLTLLASDVTSGLDRAVFSNGLPSLTVSTNGTYNLSASALDLAGNISTAQRSLQVDTTDPALTLSVPYTPDGRNGWYITRPTLGLVASDDTSGLASAAFDQGGSSFRPGEGNQLVSATARDIAGNTATVSQTFKIDTTPPLLTPSLTASSAAGWFNTPVSISLNTLDTLSGIDRSEFRLDGGAWQTGSGLIVSTDGEHTLEMRVTDNAGNLSMASRSFKLDTTPPHSAFRTPPDGTQIQAAGLLLLSGSSSDTLSGLALAEISLNDGTSWLPLPVVADRWEFAWDTESIPDGTYTVRVYADDHAGNHENSAMIAVIVGNKAPRVTIQPSWWLWEAGSLQVTARQIPIQTIRLRISCAPYHPDVALNYTVENLPASLQWNRLCGNGAFAAEGGDYPVSLQACDMLGQCAEARGVIRVPLSIPATPTLQAAFVPAASATPRPTQEHALPPVTPDTWLPTPSPVNTPTLVDSGRDSMPGSVWTVMPLAGLLLAFAASALADPRPRALRRLGKTFHQVRYGPQ